MGRRGGGPCQDITYLGARLQTEIRERKSNSKRGDRASGSSVGHKQGDKEERVKTNNTETLEPRHKETPPKKIIKDPEEIRVFSSTDNMGEFKGTCDSCCSAA